MAKPIYPRRQPNDVERAYLAEMDRAESTFLLTNKLFYAVNARPGTVEAAVFAQTTAPFISLASWGHETVPPERYKRAHNTFSQTLDNYAAIARAYARSAEADVSGNPAESARWRNDAVQRIAKAAGKDPELIARRRRQLVEAGQ